MNKLKFYKKDILVEILILALAIISLTLSFSFINDKSLGRILCDFFKIKVNITLISFILSTIILGISYRLNQNSYIVKSSKIISLICIWAIILFTMTTILF